MFAKFRAMSPRRAETSPLAPAHSNDNGIDARCSAAPRRIRRSILACRWRPIGGGRLECHWDIEITDEAATEEPDRRWLIRRSRRLTGSETAAGRSPCLRRDELEI